MGLMVAALSEVWMVGTAPGPRGVGTVVALLSTLPLAWRRRTPWIAVTGAVTAIVLPLFVRPLVETDGLFVAIAWLVAVHGINAYSGPRTALLGTLAVVVPAVLTTLAVPAPSEMEKAASVMWILAVFATAATAGQVMRLQRVRLERERVVAEEEARAVERRRLAGELHDVVAHGVAVMVVQAGAAQELLRVDPDHASRLLDAVQRTGEQSAAELRRMLNVLGADELGLEPQPALADLPALVEGLRATGIQAELEMSTGADAIAPGLQVTAYRIVQESLTNALKHGARSAVSVAVRSNGYALVVTVSDANAGTPGPISGFDASGSSGHGLQGLRERVRLYGGTLLAGPQRSSWRVEAVLPLYSGLEPMGADPARVEPETRR